MRPTEKSIAIVAALLLCALATQVVAEPPEFEPLYKKRVLYNTLFSLEVWASDPQGYPMTISVSNKPPSAIFTPHSVGGVLHYVPDAGEIGMTYTTCFYAVSAGGMAMMPVPIMVVGSEEELNPYWLQRDVMAACGELVGSVSYRSHTAGGQGQPVGWTAGGVWLSSGGFFVPDVASTATNRLIAASASDGGIIAPSGTVIVADGANQAFTVTPSAYYFISDLEVDGVSVGATNGYAFVAVRSNRAIRAVFEAHLTSQGVPWWWLASYGLTNQPWDEAAATDQGGGVPAWESWVAGTDPTDPATTFCVEAAARSASGRAQVAMKTVSGRRYTFWSAANLFAPSWQRAEYSLTPAGSLTNRTLEATAAQTVIYVPMGAERTFIRPSVEAPQP